MLGTAQGTKDRYVIEQNWPPQAPTPQSSALIELTFLCSRNPVCQSSRSSSNFEESAKTKEWCGSFFKYWPQKDSRPQSFSWKFFSCLEKRSFVFHRAKEGHKMNCLLMGCVSERPVCGRCWPWATEIFRSETQRTPGNSFGLSSGFLHSYLLTPPAYESILVSCKVPDTL